MLEKVAVIATVRTKPRNRRDEVRLIFTSLCYPKPTPCPKVVLCAMAVICPPPVPSFCSQAVIHSHGRHPLPQCRHPLPRPSSVPTAVLPPVPSFCTKCRISVVVVVPPRTRPAQPHLFLL